MLKDWFAPFRRVVLLPLFIMASAYICYGVSLFFVNRYISDVQAANITKATNLVLQFIMVSCIYWIFLRVLSYIDQRFTAYFEKTGYQRLKLAVTFFINCLHAILVLGFSAFILDLLPLPKQFIQLTDKLFGILIIAIIAWILLNFINLLEKYMVIYYRVDDVENLFAQKAYTQVIFLKRLIIGVILILAFGSSLMQFDNVRQLGVSILASAGIVTIIAGFAIQKVLSILISGLQIALNQPIKINDYVTVENEFGQIEEITFYHVVVKIWDQRRLIIPINYFFEKPFQNLSRSSKNLTGPIYFYVDYFFPVAKLKREFARVVNASSLWDKKVLVMQVVECKEMTIQIRGLVSADNPGNLWNLQCEVREALLSYIRNNFADNLPKTRVEIIK